jgi:predicted site-specific integrase-resolvase
MIKLSDWCVQNGIAYSTAWRWRRDGKFPHPTTKIGRTVFVTEDSAVHGIHLISSCPHCGEQIEIEVVLR